MKTETKTFDCVEMKRVGTLRTYEKIKGMTLEQKVAYWRERNRLFHERRAHLAMKSERHFSAIDSGDPSSSDNERIDADLAKEYGRHDSRGE